MWLVERQTASRVIFCGMRQTFWKWKSMTGVQGPRTSSPSSGPFESPATQPLGRDLMDPTYTCLTSG
jgi:hypothetical protein